MRLYIITFFFLLSVKFCFGQKQEIDDLANQVIIDEIHANFKYFNLVDTSGTTRFFLGSEIYTLDFKFRFFDKYPDFPKEYFLSMNDSTRINWKDYHLKKAKIQDYKSIPKYGGFLRNAFFLNRKLPKSYIDSVKKNLNYNEILVLYGKNWSEKRKLKVMEARWKKHDKKVKTENKEYYIFSKPLFSENYDYAIIQIETGHSKWKLIYKKMGNTWKQVYTFDIIVA